MTSRSLTLQLLKRRRSQDVAVQPNAWSFAYSKVPQGCSRALQMDTNMEILQSGRGYHTTPVAQHVPVGFIGLSLPVRRDPQ